MLPKAKNILLIEPKYPIHPRSRNHANFLPIGLLKIASYYRNNGSNIKLIRYDEGIECNFKPDIIFVTSLFTYWCEYVKESVEWAKQFDAPIIVGGIYASLMPDHCKDYTQCDYIVQGVIDEVEDLIPAYDLVDVDYQIIHTTRGCIRKCSFCGTYCIEPKFTYKKSIKDIVSSEKIIFYDNNLLANPYIENILDELISLKIKGKIKHVESQSGFDGRILLKNPLLAKKIKQINFKNIKIAWDGSIDDADNIEKQIGLLADAGYNRRNISVFILYNHDLDYNECEKKRVKCFQWGVQVIDCRFKPLNQTFDYYNGMLRREQTSEEYFIHDRWTDKQIKSFRRNCRRHNICIRQKTKFYSYTIEKKKIPKEKLAKYKTYDFKKASMLLDDCWDPAKVNYI